MKKVELFEKDKYKNIEPLARNMARGDMNSFFRFFSQQNENVSVLSKKYEKICKKM